MLFFHRITITTSPSPLTLHSTHHLDYHHLYYHHLYYHHHHHHGLVLCSRQISSGRAQTLAELS